MPQPGLSGYRVQHCSKQLLCILQERTPLIVLLTVTDTHFS